MDKKVEKLCSDMERLISDEHNLERDAALSAVKNRDDKDIFEKYCSEADRRASAVYALQRALSKIQFVLK